MEDGGKEGWAWPLNSRKAHFFREGRSLCKKWMFWGKRFTDNQKEGSPDDCKDCSRRRAKELDGQG